MGSSDATGREDDTDETGNPHRTRRGLTLLLGSSVTLVVVEVLLVIFLLMGLVFLGGVATGQGGAAAGGLIGLFVTLIALGLGLFIWIILTLVALLFLFLGRSELGPAHRRSCLAGIGLLAAAVVGSAALGGQGMLLGSGFTGSGDVGLLTQLGGLGVGVVGLIGQVLLIWALQDDRGRNMLYGFVGAGVAGGAVSVAGSLASISILGLAAAALGLVAQLIYVVTIQGTRKRVGSGQVAATPEADRPATPKAAQAGGGGASGTATAGAPDEPDVFAVACASCGAHIPIEEEERPLVVECPECGQRGVVKASPGRTGGDEAEPSGEEE